MKKQWFLNMFAFFASSLLRPILGRFWAHRSRIGLKSEQARKTKIFKKPLTFFNDFVSPRGRKSIKNRPKIVSKSILKKRAKEHPKIVQKVANMAPKSTQVGAMLASKTVLDPPKSQEKTTPKTRQKKQPQHKPV